MFKSISIVSHWGKCVPASFMWRKKTCLNQSVLCHTEGSVYQQVSRDKKKTCLNQPVLCHTEGSVYQQVSCDKRQIKFDIKLWQNRPTLCLKTV